MSTTRRREGAANKAVEIENRKNAKVAAKGKVQLRAPLPMKEPSARPYQEPEMVVKEKRVVRAVSDRDGLNLLRKIEAKGGRDIIVMMRDSARPLQEIVDGLMLNETIVITSLDAYGSSKDRVKRLEAAIMQAPHYLKDSSVRPVTKGVKKQRRQDEALAKQDEMAKLKKNPKTRVLIAPTLDEVSPKLSDTQIMLEELTRYLGLNTSLRNSVVSATSDLKATRILILNVGQRFDVKMKTLLRAPSEYHDRLAEVGAAIRRDARKYDTSDTTPIGPRPTIQETPEATARHQSQQDALDKYTKAMDTKEKRAQSDTDEPEMETKRETFNHQEEVLKLHLANLDVHS